MTAQIEIAQLAKGKYTLFLYEANTKGLISAEDYKKQTMHFDTNKYAPLYDNMCTWAQKCNIEYSNLFKNDVKHVISHFTSVLTNIKDNVLQIKNTILEKQCLLLDTIIQYIVREAATVKLNLDAYNLNVGTPRDGINYDQCIVSDETLMTTIVGCREDIIRLGGDAWAKAYGDYNNARLNVNDMIVAYDNFVLYAQLYNSDIKSNVATELKNIKLSLISYVNTEFFKGSLNSDILKIPDFQQTYTANVERTKTLILQFNSDILVPLINGVTDVTTQNSLAIIVPRLNEKYGEIVTSDLNLIRKLVQYNITIRQKSIVDQKIEAEKCKTDYIGMIDKAHTNKCVGDTETDTEKNRFFTLFGASFGSLNNTFPVCDATIDSIKTVSTRMNLIIRLKTDLTTNLSNLKNYILSNQYVLLDICIRHMHVKSVECLFEIKDNFVIYDTRTLADYATCMTKDEELMDKIVKCAKKIDAHTETTKAESYTKRCELYKKKASGYRNDYLEYIKSNYEFTHKADTFSTRLRENMYISSVKKRLIKMFGDYYLYMQQEYKWLPDKAEGICSHLEVKANIDQVMETCFPPTFHPCYRQVILAYAENSSVQTILFHALSLKTAMHAFMFTVQNKEYEKSRDNYNLHTERVIEVLKNSVKTENKKDRMASLDNLPMTTYNALDIRIPNRNILSIAREARSIITKPGHEYEEEYTNACIVIEELSGYSALSHIRQL